MLHCNNNYHIMFVRQCIEQNTSVLRKDLTILESLDLHLLHQLQSGHLCWRSLLIQILFCYRYTHRSEIMLRASKSLRPFKSSPPSCRLSFPVFVFALPSQSALLCFAYFACRCQGPCCQQIRMTKMIMMIMMKIRQGQI